MIDQKQHNKMMNNINIFLIGLLLLLINSTNSYSTSTNGESYPTIKQRPIVYYTRIKSKPATTESYDDGITPSTPISDYFTTTASTSFHENNGSLQSLMNSLLKMLINGKSVQTKYLLVIPINTKMEKFKASQTVKLKRRRKID